MKTTTAPKDRLFETAARLFHQYGYRAVGVDTIAAEAGIGKMTMYRHFPSKDDLIVAFLRRADEEFWSYFEASAKDAPAAREKLLAFFTALQDYTTTPACFGCPFINIATEYAEADHAGRQIAIDHKQAVRARFIQLAKAAGARHPKALADSLMLLMDGAYMAARMYGASPHNPARHLAQAATQLLDAHGAT